MASIITALGTTVWQPFVKERGTEAKLASAQKQIDLLVEKVGNLESMIAEKDNAIKAKEARVDDLVKQLSLATESNSRLADRLFRTSGKLLEVVGKIKPLTEALRPVPVDNASPRHAVLLLEDDDDVQSVTTNMEASDEVMEAYAGS